MSIQYIVLYHPSEKDLKKGIRRKFVEGTSDSLRDSKEHFQHLCELYPQEKFSVVKKETIETTICESEDYRQQLFKFE